MTTQIDPFAAVRFRPKSVQENPQVEQPVTSEDPFAAVRIKQAEGFPQIKEIGRHAARIGSRIAETIGGIPGDIENLVQSGVFYGLEKLTGRKPSEEAKKISKGFRRFPTSHELKEKSEELTEGFTSPQGPTEKSVDEFVQTAASLLGPLKFRKALGVALGSQLAKEGLKISGVGEGTQEAGKLGTMFLLTAMNPGGAMKYARNQFEIADRLSRGSSINASRLEKNVNNLVKDLEKGIPTRSKSAVTTPANDILNKINNGKISIQDLTAAKRDINSIMGDPETLKGAKKLLSVLGKEVDLAIKPYEAINPAFAKVYRPANEIFGSVMQGNKAFNFVKKTLGAKSLLGATLAEMTLGHPEAILPTVAGAAGIAGAAKGADFFMRLAESPELRKYYAKAMLAAAKEDAGALRFYEEKIEDFVDKD